MAAKIVKKVNPEYPEWLKRDGIEGTVLIEAVVSQAGDIVSAKVENTLVHADLAKAALDAVRQWQFQPTLLNGAPIEVVTRITVRFQLN